MEIDTYEGSWGVRMNTKWSKENNLEHKKAGLLKKKKKKVPLAHLAIKREYIPILAVNQGMAMIWIKEGAQEAQYMIQIYLYSF